jgi:hypothetical protein
MNAFEPDAFQNDAFQAADLEFVTAFQPDAFQNDAFQIVPYQPQLLKGGGGDWRTVETFENEILRQRLEHTIEEIDDQLVVLADEVKSEDPHRIVTPDLLPPSWRVGRDTREENRQSRPEVKKDPYRHVHYNFASDLDFGVRRRIVGILDRAEHRGVDIFGSEAFRTAETARVRGQLVVQNTNAWVLRLRHDARLDLAREAVSEGFRLVSFDDTSLSFVYKPGYPWKVLLLGAGAGAALMGAGVATGYLIWGRSPKTGH